MTTRSHLAVFGLLLSCRQQFLNDCSEIEIFGYTKILNSWIFSDFLCELNSLNAGFHRGMNMRRVDIPGFVSGVLSDKSIRLLRADEQVFDAMVTGWRSQMIAHGVTSRHLFRCNHSQAQLPLPGQQVVSRLRGGRKSPDPGRSGWVFSDLLEREGREFRGEFA
jgi:hypothetical protein